MQLPLLHRNNHLHLNKTPNKRNAAIFASAFALIGLIALVSSFAATSSDTKVVEAEATDRTGAVTRQYETAASSGEYVEFGLEPASASFPNASNTGVPDGTVLSAYTGPCTITIDNTVIDAKIVNCGLRIQANNVTISQSIINGALYGTEADSFTVTDSEVALIEGGDTVINNSNFTVLRSEIRGGRRGVYCLHNCTVQDSWIHGQYLPPDSNWHVSGMRASQDTRYIHNTISCDATNTASGGCSANLTMYGDFEPVERVLIQGNYFTTTGAHFCSYGGSTPGKTFSNGARDIVFRDNIFERGPTGNCGLSGPIVSFDSSAPGNIFTGNYWDDGQPL